MWRRTNGGDVGASLDTSQRTFRRGGAAAPRPEEEATGQIEDFAGEFALPERLDRPPITPRGLRNLPRSARAGGPPGTTRAARSDRQVWEELQEQWTAGLEAIRRLEQRMVEEEERVQNVVGNPASLGVAALHRLRGAKGRLLETMEELLQFYQVMRSLSEALCQLNTLQREAAEAETEEAAAREAALREAAAQSLAQQYLEEVSFVPEKTRPNSQDILHRCSNFFSQGVPSEFGRRPQPAATAEQQKSKKDSKTPKSCSAASRCCICFEGFEPKEAGLRVFPCHKAFGCPSLFHGSCVVRWTVSSGKLECPLCRRCWAPADSAASVFPASNEEVPQEEARGPLNSSAGTTPPGTTTASQRSSSSSSVQPVERDAGSNNALIGGQTSRSPRQPAPRRWGGPPSRLQIRTRSNNNGSSLGTAAGENASSTGDTTQQEYHGATRRFAGRSHTLAAAGGREAFRSPSTTPRPTPSLRPNFRARTSLGGAVGVRPLGTPGRQGSAPSASSELERWRATDAPNSARAGGDLLQQQPPPRSSSHVGCRLPGLSLRGDRRS